MMNVANVESRRQLNEIENPHQFVAAARHVTDCNCEIDNHFMNFLPIKLIIVSKINKFKGSFYNNLFTTNIFEFTTSNLKYF